MATKKTEEGLVLFPVKRSLVPFVPPAPAPVEPPAKPKKKKRGGKT